MVHNMEMSREDNIPSTLEPMSVGRTIDVLSDPGKMVTHLALGTFTPRQKPTFSDVADRVNELQGAYRTREVWKEHIKSHCPTLFAAGLITANKEGVPGISRPTHVLRWTEKGATIGKAICGAMTGLQLETPEEGFLERTMGIRADTVRDSPRPRIYEKLLDGPAGTTEIATFAGITLPQVTHFVQRLCDDNVLSHRSLDGPENRRYFLAAGDFPANPTSPITSYILEAAMALRTRDHQIVTGKDILDKVGSVAPRLPRDVVWYALGAWMQYKPHRRGLIRPLEEITPGQAHSEVSIIPTLKPYIQRMMDIRQLLTGDDKEAHDFQEQARTDAEQIIDSPELVAQLLGYKSSYITSDYNTGGEIDSWTETAESIYFSQVADGKLKLPLEELHQLALEQIGRRISVKQFQAHLMESSTLLLRVQPGQARGLRLPKYAIGKNVVLSMDWAKADCRFDPDLFFPPDNTDASVPQAERAKRICESCPMKLPCLKLAVDVEENATGVRGAVWLDSPEEVAAKLTPETRTLLSFITVKEA